MSINRAKTPPKGDIPVKSIAEVEWLVDELEVGLMGQSVHAEHGSHAAGAHQHDPNVYLFHVNHDLATWKAKFDENQVWLADADANPSELVYDIKAENTDDQGTVDNTALYSEESDIFTANREPH